MKVYFPCEDCAHFNQFFGKICKKKTVAVYFKKNIKHTEAACMDYLNRESKGGKEISKAEARAVRIPAHQVKPAT